MRITRIYYHSPVTPGATLTLDANASNHLVRVLRCKRNAALVVFNGQGGEYACTLVDANPRAASIAVGSFTDIERESPLQVTLVQGLSRGEHMDASIQKATELGASAIVPLICERSSSMNKERLGKKLGRWRQIAISACEQSGRNRLPVIDEAIDFETAIAELDTDLKLILDPGAQLQLHDVAGRATRVGILCGPEGGFSEQEIQAAADAGFERIGFGPRVLRTETAGPAMIAALQTLWGDMG